MKYAILGAAHGHVFTFAEHMAKAGWELACILQDQEENSRRLSEEYGAPLVEGVSSVLKQGITVAGCFGPGNERIGMIRACAEYGVHVMSDKPLVVNKKDFRILEDILTNGRIQVGALFTLRFQPSVRALKELLEQGKLGKLISIEILNPHKLTPWKRPEWHFSPDQAGGVAADLFTHSVDLFHWLSNRSEILVYNSFITKSILPEKPNFYDFASASLRTEDGISGYFRVDWHMPQAHWNWGDVRIFCVGSNGCAELRASGDPLNRREMLILYSENEETKEIPLPDYTEDETSDFLNRIAGQPCIVTHEDILHACQISLALEDKAVRQNRLL